MDKKIIVVNAGSTSIKLAVYQMPIEEKVISYLANGVNLDLCTVEETTYPSEEIGQTKKFRRTEMPAANHEEIIKYIFKRLVKKGLKLNKELYFGHRFVNGGEIFSKSIIYSSDYDVKLKELEKLAPLHNPINFKVLKIITDIIPNSNHVLVFDTSFHTSIPIENFIYPIPYKYYEKNKIRKYGAHGTSYRYILKTMENILSMKNLNLIVCHVGGGVSICAIKNGRSVNTSMGLTPLGGAIMATRSGDLDPSICNAITNLEEGNSENTTKILNEKSGLLGITNNSKCSDFRYLIKQAREKNKQGRLALAMFTQKIIDYIAQYYFQLHGEVHAIVLTGGIGENSIEFRNIVFNTLGKVLGIKLNQEKASVSGDSFILLNKTNDFPLFCVARTNEEKIIALDTYELLSK